MPKITINVNEEQPLASFDATENTVLIPILVYQAETDVKVITKKYTSAAKLKADYADIALNYNPGNQKDRSYIMAYELLLQGMNVVVEPLQIDDNTVSSYESKGFIKFAEKSQDSDPDRIEWIEELAYQKILHTLLATGCLDKFKNKNIYNIKFITSGGYANAGHCTLDDNLEYDDSTNCGIATILDEIASARGDAISFAEFRSYVNDSGLAEFNSDLEGASLDTCRNSCILFPWILQNVSYKGSAIETVNMPACFGYLIAFATSTRTNANWFAVSGVQRGKIPNLVGVNVDVGESYMHSLQGDGDSNTRYMVNPIMKINDNYGFRIWGNKVANSTGEMFTDYMNVRILLCDLKKQLYNAALVTTFEPNDDIVWFNFKAQVNTLLERMKSGRGIKSYQWVKEKALDDAGNVRKGVLKARLYITPIEAVETFEINIELTDEDVTLVESSVATQRGI